LHLASEAPHAKDILLTYAELLDVQARVAEAVPLGRWIPLAEGGRGPSRLGLDRLPVAEMLPLFSDFLASAAGLGTDVMRSDASKMSSTSSASWIALLGSALSADSDDDDPPFHIRAFLQSVATALVTPLTSEVDHAVEPALTRRCPVCGGSPVVGALQDVPEALGIRSLICGVCGGAWRSPRLTCAYCGEDDADELTVHAAESLPWIRLDACKSCRRYLKIVDLRRRGDAVPLVDDVATVEMDLWAQQRGLHRVQTNLFGL
jgi:FdhE protein